MSSSCIIMCRVIKYSSPPRAPLVFCHNIYTRTTLRIPYNRKHTVHAGLHVYLLNRRRYNTIQRRSAKDLKCFLIKCILSRPMTHIELTQLERGSANIFSTQHYIIEN